MLTDFALANDVDDARLLDAIQPELSRSAFVGVFALEEGEPAPHDFGISGSPSTMEVFPVNGETSSVQTFLPWRTVTWARSV